MLLEEESLQDKEFQIKEQLYNFYYELSSEIKNKKIELEEDDYEQIIKSSTINQIINYIKQAIQILYDKAVPRQHKAVNPSERDICLYEQRLRYYEQQQRISIKNEFQNRLLKEALEIRVEDYMEMETEFEEMKAKYKYEEGKFLENDRKENEVIIVKKENTYLKKTIDEKEKIINELKNKIVNQDKTIQHLKQKLLNSEKAKIESKEGTIEALMNQVGGFTYRNSKEFNSPRNINICNFNTPNFDTNYITKSGITTPFHLLNLKKEIDDGSNDKIKFVNINIKSVKSSNKVYNNSNNLLVVSGGKIQDYSTASPNSPKSQAKKLNKKKVHQRNNSMGKILDNKKTDLISKYFTNKNSSHNLKGNIIYPAKKVAATPKNTVIGHNANSRVKYDCSIKHNSAGENKSSLNCTSTSVKKSKNGNINRSAIQSHKENN